jgi:hypothetical protein
MTTFDCLLITLQVIMKVTQVFLLPVAGFGTAFILISNWIDSR